jgi:hypothetical protein
MHVRSLGLLLLAVAVVFVACGDDDSAGEGTGGSGPAATLPDDAIAIRASSDIGLGAERLLLGIGDASGARLGGPDQPVMIAVHPASDDTAVQETDGIWTWIVPDATGLYRATFDFDEPGTWVATVTPAGADPLDPVLFSVQEDPFAPALGEPAPIAPTPTLDDATLEELTTDPDPESAFYETTIEEAVASGRPTVLVFSTPAYCQTAACGPLLDNVKEIAPDHPGVNFIHIEVFTGLTEPDFIPDAAHVAPAVGPDWYSLPSEPWVFVIDEAGIVQGRFEGVMDPGELEAILP